MPRFADAIRTDAGLAGSAAAVDRPSWSGGPGSAVRIGMTVRREQGRPLTVMPRPTVMPRLTVMPRWVRAMPAQTRLAMAAKQRTRPTLLDGTPVSA
jgi:hypothetical protein